MPRNHRPQGPRTFDTLLDDVDRALLGALGADGRRSLADMSREVGLSAPAVSERLRRLEATGVITGYSVSVDLRQIGYPVLAFVRLSVADPLGAREALTEAFHRSEVLEAHHVIGEDCWVLKVTACDTEHLEQVLYDFARLGRTTTSMVLSSPVPGRSVPALH